MIHCRSSGVMTLVCAGLYCALLCGADECRYFLTEDASADDLHATPALAHTPPLARHALLLIASSLPIGLLAEELARPVDYLIETMHMPAALGGIIIAILVATPEAIAATRAALANALQQAVNIFLGSVLSTIGNSSR